MILSTVRLALLTVLFGLTMPTSQAALDGSAMMVCPEGKSPVNGACICSTEEEGFTAVSS